MVDTWLFLIFQGFLFAVLGGIYFRVERALDELQAIRNELNRLQRH